MSTQQFLNLFDDADGKVNIAPELRREVAISHLRVLIQKSEQVRVVKIID